MFPNSAKPVLLYRGALPGSAAAAARILAGNNWSNAWQNGIYPFHHFHSTAHEVLVIVAGAVRVVLGGPGGEAVDLRAGDAVVVPAGVAHRNLGGTADLLVVGAYPGGASFDTLRGDPAENAAAASRSRTVPVPGTDPVHGADGPLPRLWAANEG